jgi:endonuclease I
LQRHTSLRSFRNTLRFVTILAVQVLGSLPAGAAPPPGYYDSVDTTNPTVLRATLHAVIDDHTRFPYTSSSTDTWDILEQADENPANSTQILDLYRNRAYTKFGGGTGPYNREHSWPNSYGFPNDGPTNYPYTDCHHLFLCDVGYNGDRANKPFGNCAPGATERVTDVNDGQGGGSGVFPGNSDWFNGNDWQTWNGRKGDVARAMFYMDVRYEGGTHGITGAAEPDLILTDNRSLIVSTGGNASVAYMGLLSVLIQWNAEDPVDDRERARNDVVYSYQGNRNPFIDHPEWVNALFVASTGPTIVAIVDVPADQGGQLQVDWQRNSLDVVGSIAPIAQYAIQRLETSWVDVVLQPATQSTTYSLVIPTDDIASPANPQPESQYRVAAIETGGTVRLSNLVGAYSVDNVPPPDPVLAIDTGHVPWVISWQIPSIPDFGQSCLYRGNATGFTPTTPLLCTLGSAYLEYDNNLHFYVLQFSDAHGNHSGFSNEVVGLSTDTASIVPLRTAINSVYPNPFNPSANVSFSLAEAGPVRIDVYSADGRLVRTLLDAQRGPGAFDLRWDGTDAQGSRLANGSYWLRLSGAGQIDTRKVVLLK